MSLLMDALRKAEQEKKEAAKRLKETADGELSGDVTASNVANQTGSGTAGDITAEQMITRMVPTVVRSKEEIFAATAAL